MLIHSLTLCNSRQAEAGARHRLGGGPCQLRPGPRAPAPSGVGPRACSHPGGLERGARRQVRSSPERGGLGDRAAGEGQGEQSAAIFRGPVGAAAPPALSTPTQGAAPPLWGPWPVTVPRGPRAPRSLWSTICLTSRWPQPHVQSGPRACDHLEHACPRGTGLTPGGGRGVFLGGELREVQAKQCAAVAQSLGL